MPYTSQDQGCAQTSSRVLTYSCVGRGHYGEAKDRTPNDASDDSRCFYIKHADTGNTSAAQDNQSVGGSVRDDIKKLSFVSKSENETPQRVTYPLQLVTVELESLKIGKWYGLTAPDDQL